MTTTTTRTETATDISERAWRDVRAVLDGRQTTAPTDPETTVMLGRAIDERISNRDALLMLAIDPALTVNDAMALARHPHRPENVRLMERSVAAAWRDDPDDRNLDRIRRAADLARRIDRTAETRRALTIAAYLEWWAGDTQAAETDALIAVADDPKGNTLAAIVLNCLGNDIQPVITIH
ncbi:hypothetical protein [Bifidobacterium simiarum]|uniref:hypothetical protein n=1 Tax=Bifidobacterium simiarum TaxID=2045441 RepID=UPI001BDC9F81|nr:hypothetical protein [Bifidobacterium simiarum]MBT1167261.1 hypothetical protein [Bifidobacterium simiarum]